MSRKQTKQEKLDRWKKKPNPQWRTPRPGEIKAKIREEEKKNRKTPIW